MTVSWGSHATTIPLVKAAQLWYLLSFYYYENEQLYNSAANFTSTTYVQAPNWIRSDVRA